MSVSPFGRPGAHSDAGRMIAKLEEQSHPQLQATSGLPNSPIHHKATTSRDAYRFSKTGSNFLA
jgi:hypothetical protein